MIGRNMIDKKPVNDTMVALNRLYENGHITEDKYIKSKKVLKNSPIMHYSFKYILW